MLLSFHKSLYIKDLRVHPTGFEPVTFGSVGRTNKLLALSLYLFYQKVYDKYASIFGVS